MRRFAGVGLALVVALSVLVGGAGAASAVRPPVNMSHCHVRSVTVTSEQRELTTRGGVVYAVQVRYVTATVERCQWQYVIVVTYSPWHPIET